MTAEDHRISVAVLGSGAGSNAAALIDYSSRQDSSYRIDLVIATRGNAGIVSVAADRDIPVVVLPAECWEGALISELRSHRIAVLALAGFLRKLPETVISELNGNVLNIHPALLPKFGGHGMYGLHVHAAVIEARESITGATVHRVTPEYDEGAILAQTSIGIGEADDPQTLQNRVKAIEHVLYPEVMGAYCRQIRDASIPAPLPPHCNSDTSFCSE